ncbi:DUF1450 domain-containing protein [Paenibacillus sp. NEAU-GSW1]|uniref:DUF1450 domain-containing protein n=1 Tax=Paenibacillus sp. NEAU-GSW1 TaxID=2682486 RepID=UPI00156420BC|nr:DUF1450 domain-containing protein [Paenibacillus sp. NEAU-GSW1]
MSLGLVVVEVCDRNAMALLPLEELEEKYPEAAVMRTNCLNMCNMCRARPYAMVNENRVHAPTTEECLSLVEEAVREEIRQFFE